jgi:hypothetical protein
MSLLLILPNEILKLINEHLQATIIQSIFKLHRPLSIFQCGDRIMILNKKYETIIKIFGTINKTNDKFSEIKLLPRIIPNWKKCNINFWNNYQCFLKDYYFPYYIPKSINVSNDKIIKLCNWNDNINVIDSTKRLTYFKNKVLFKKTSMFNYIF